jgi:hypothetical protein
MWRFMIVTFAFLAVAFYELSGGADYRPADGSRQAMALTQPKLIKTAKITPVKTTIPAVQPASETVITFASASADISGAVAQPLSGKTLVAANIITPVAGVLAFDTAKALDLTTPAATPVILDITSAAVNVADFRRVTGSRVNMRMGPGTTYDVMASLLRDDRVEVLQDPGDGWVKLRVVDSGRVGWMADFLLVTAD